MVEQDLKWYSTFVFLVGTILSFADPITDILTLVEFYREDHKTWFGVGLTFVILPCLPFACLNCCISEDEDDDDDDDEELDAFFRKVGKMCLKHCLPWFNPFSAAFARLRGFIFCLRNFKKLWKGESVDFGKTDVILGSTKISAFIEAILESAPQFIIQLYAMSAQQEPVKIIQMISLPVSLISLTWTFTAVDQLINDDIEMNVKHKLLSFITRLLVLSSRMFAICFFIVAYKWWCLAFMMFHSSSVLLLDLVWCIRKRGSDSEPVGLLLPIFFVLHWLRDDFSAALFDVDPNSGRKEQRKKVLWLSNALFAAENLTMILLFYLSPHSNTWYSLPVTVCVSSLSVIGGAMRVLHYTSLLRSRDQDFVPQGKTVELVQPVQPV